MTHSTLRITNLTLVFSAIKIFCLLLLSGISRNVFGQEIGLVPHPQSITFKEGTFTPNGDTLKYYLATDPYFTLKPQLDSILLRLNKQVKQVTSKDKAHIQIGTTKSLGTSLKDDRPGSEGYHLVITPSKIVIQAYDPKGVFYGVQTLSQLLNDPKIEVLPCMEIKDWPDFPVRGLMDDISRGPIPNMEYMKKQIRRLASMKINMMSFYIEHVVKTQQHAAFAPPEAITIAEWKELSEYARRYHIHLTGSFQSLGHFRNILIHPAYAPLGVTDRMLYPGKSEAITFLKEVYDEMIPAFNGPYFNINCDEAFDLGRGATQALADSIGNAKLFAQHVTPLLDYVMEKGKQPMMWADMALAHPEVFAMIPKETMMMTWEYGRRDTFSALIDPIVDAGLNFMVCPGVLNSNRLMPDFDMATTNIRDFVTEGYEKGAKGVMNTVWDDGGRHFFSRDWYGIAYGADQSWNPNRKRRVEFDSSLSRAVYQDKHNLLPEMLHTLNQLNDFGPTQEMNNQVMWQQIFPNEGESLLINMNEWESIYEILQKADSLLNIWQESAKQEEISYWRFTLDQYMYLYKSRRYALEIAGLYRAASMERGNSTHETLDTCISKVRELNDVLFLLKSTFQELWMRENRSYWLDIALEAYEKKLQTLKEVEHHLLKAKLQWKSHNYLPPPRNIRLDINETVGQYFSYWLITGPFEIEHDEGPHPDFLVNMGGENEARPGAGEYFLGPSGEQYMWDKYQSARWDQINLMDYFSPTYRSVAYTYCRINSPGDQTVRATLGSNDGIVVYCNGEKVFEKYAKRSLIPDEDECMLPLIQGNNHILVKIDQWKGDWGFSFRLPDFTIRNHKYKYEMLSE